MRREGYEVQVSQPQVIIKEENGVKTEPFEEITIDVPESSAGVIIEKLSRRRGQMIDLKNTNGQTRLIFEIPTRGILGYRSEFIVDTKGEGILCSRFIGFKPLAGDIERSALGSMVSMMSGKALAFSLWNLQERGVLYIRPNIDVYEGMVIGNVSKGNDLTVNPIKGKKLTNVRASGSDEAITLTRLGKLILKRLKYYERRRVFRSNAKSIRLRKNF
jgi:GTP-binding protein